MSSMHISAARSNVRQLGGDTTRVLALAGVSAIALLVGAAPASADCTVSGDTTTCSGDLSGGVGTNTANVIVNNVTADIAPPAGNAGFWLPGATHVDITLGGFAINAVNSNAIVTDAITNGGPRDFTLDFQGAINTSGSGWIHGIGLHMPEAPGSNIVVRSNGDIAANAVQTEPNPPGNPSGRWETWGIVANGGAGTSNITSTGDITVSMSGPMGSQPPQAGAIGSFGQGGAAVTSTGDLSVEAEHGAAIGISINGGTGGATVANTGDIYARSAVGGAMGISIAAQGNVSVLSQGDIQTSSAENAAFQISHGIAVAGRNNTVVSTGDIDTDGRRASGILVTGPVTITDNTLTIEIPESTNVTSTGNITTQGPSSAGILAMAEAVQVQSDGEIETYGDGSSGIVAARSYSYDYTNGSETPRDFSGASAAVINDGRITTLGAKSKGIFAGADTVSILTSGPVSTSGYDSAAVMGMGDFVSITNAGNINTGGGLSAGIAAVRDFGFDQNGQPFVDYTGSSAAIVSEGHIVTTGDGSVGMVAGAANASIRSAGDITTSGAGANGMVVRGGVAYADSAGAITTTGADASGILASGSQVIINSTGNISTLGQDALGIEASGSEVFVASEGDIATSGFAGIGIGAFGDDLEVVSEGNISTAGDLSGGILALRDAGFDDQGQPYFNYDATVVDVANAGNISTSGNRSVGIGAGARLGTATVVSAGDISTLGEYSGAIYATGKSAAIASVGDISTAGIGEFIGAGGGALFAQSVNGASGTDTAEIASIGNISTEGEFAFGLTATSGNQQGLRPGTSSIVTVGDIVTTGFAATGAFAGGGDSEIVSTGNVMTAGDYAKGLHVAANVNDGVAIIRSAGNVTTTGSLEAMALLGTGAHVTIESLGDVTTTGQGSYGIMAAGAFQIVDGDAFLTAASKTVNISTNGAVTVTGEGTAGIVALGDMVEIEVDGSVTSNYVGVLIGDNVQDLQSGSNPDARFSLVNRGAISGSTTGVFSALQTTLVNAGTLDSADGVDALLSDFDDEVILQAGSLYDGYIHGAAGNDTAILRGAELTAADGQTFGGFVDFEALNVESGYWSNIGLVGTLGQVNVAQGATLDLADVELDDGVVYPLSTDLLTTDGLLVLDFTNSAALTSFVSNTPMTGDGGLRLEGEGVLELSDTSSLGYAGATTVANGAFLLTGAFDGDIATAGDGVFQLGDGGTAGDFTGDLVNDGVFVFNRSDDYSLLGDFSGSGLLSKHGGGLLTFAGDYNFEGTTEIVDGGVKFAGQIDPEADFELGDGGVLDVSGQNQTIGGLQGGGQSSVNVDGGQLTVSQTENTTFQGVIAGGGGLVKTGGGTLNLTGTNTYTGTTQVTGGKLAVNGSIVSLVVLSDGGALGGNGTVGTVNAGAGGIVAPGNSIGQLTVAGDLTFGPGSVYEVETNAAGQADRLDATGRATIASSATVQVLAESGDYARRTDYTILTAAGGINGTFGNVTSNFAFLTPRLGYTTNAVTLSLYRNDVNFADAALTANQRAVAAAAQGLGVGDALFDQILVQSDASARAAFDQLSGEIYDSTLAGVTGDARRVSDAMLNGVRGAGEGAFAWAEALGVWGKTGSVDASATMDRELAGFVGGGGYRMGAWTVGVSGGVTNSDYQLVGRNDASDANSGIVGLTAGYQSGGWNATIGGSAAWHDMSTSRSLTAGTITASPSTDYDGQTTQVFAELSYEMSTGDWTVAPFGRLAYVNTTFDRIAEAAGPASLVVDADQTATFRTVGVSVSGAWGRFNPRASVGWQHVSNGNSVTTAHFASGAQTFVVNGAQLPTDAAVLDLGFDTDVGGVTLGASYVGTLSGEWQDHGLRAIASMRF